MTLFTHFTSIKSFSRGALLDQLKAHDPDGLPIHVILDNARYQQNNFVQAYADQLGITFVLLPVYSPNLNLIERLWKFVKKNVLYSVYYADFSAFPSAIDQYLANPQDTYKEELSTLLALHFQTFKIVHHLFPGNRMMLDGDFQPAIVFFVL